MEGLKCFRDFFICIFTLPLLVITQCKAEGLKNSSRMNCRSKKNILRFIEPFEIAKHYFDAELYYRKRQSANFNFDNIILAFD